MRTLIRRHSLVLALLAVLWAACGCRRQERARLEATIEEPPSLASVVHVADAATAAQLLTGFYGLEQGSWRWTAGSFSVLLRPPALASQRGARLLVKLAIPEPVIQKLQNITLKATVNNVALAPETYPRPGEYAYSREVPASALAGASAIVDFTLDKTFAPGGGDQRELGIIVTTVGLEPK